MAVLVEMSSAHGRGLIRGVVEYVQRHTDWSLHLEEAGPLQAVARRKKDGKMFWRYAFVACDERRIDAAAILSRHRLKGMKF